MHRMVEKQNFRDALKPALLELFEERQDVLRDLVVEMLEDAGLSAAIQEGLAMPKASREQVLRVLASGD